MQKGGTTSRKARCEINKNNLTHLGHSAVVRGGQGFVPRRRPRRRGRLAAAVGVWAVACTARLLLLLLKIVFILILGVVKAAGVGAHQLQDREPEAGSVDEVLAARAQELRAGMLARGGSCKLVQ